jgi:transcriptional regulator with XRE-family HTH domain
MRRPNPVFSDEYRVIRETLIAARREAGLSQAQLAARLGKANSHVALIERGQRRVDSLELYRIALCLGAKPEALFAGIAQRLDAMSTSEDAPEPRR